MVYNYGFIFPVLPMHPEALGYILRLPRILKPTLTPLYLVTSTGILLKNSIVQYYLPKHAVLINGVLKGMVVSSCTAWAWTITYAPLSFIRAIFTSSVTQVIVCINQKFLMGFPMTITVLGILLSRTLLVKSRVRVLYQLCQIRMDFTMFLLIFLVLLIVAKILC